MDSELLTCLLKFIEYFPDCLSALSRMLLRFFWTTFVETAVYGLISTVAGNESHSIEKLVSVLCSAKADRLVNQLGTFLLRRTVISF